MRSPLGNILAIIAIFSIPMVLAWRLYFSGYPVPIDPGGELFEPPAPVPEQLSFTDDNGNDFDIVGEQWTLVQALAVPCEQSCAEEIKLMRAVHSRLHRQSSALRHALWRFHGGPEMPAESAVVAIKPNDESMMRQWLGQTIHADASVWLIDPQGFAVLSYSRPLRPKDILADIKTLTSNSH